MEKDDFSLKNKDKIDKDGSEEECDWNSGQDDSNNDNSDSIEDKEDWSGSFNNDDDSNEEGEGQGMDHLVLQKIESKFMSKEYNYKILDQNKIKGLLTKKIQEIHNEYEFANLSDFIVWKLFKQHNFVTKDTMNYLQENVLTIM